MISTNQRQMNSSVGFDKKELVQEAQIRWLKPEEVLFILQNHENDHLTEAPLQKPPSGSLFLFNKRVTRFFRKDGHNWRKKKAGKTVREGHERLKVGKDEALNCYYAHGEQNPNFRRRSYWMLDPAYEHIVLVHYREINEGKKHSAGSIYLSPDCFSAPSSFCTAENQGSVSAVCEPYQSSFSPGSRDFNSEIFIRSNGGNHMIATVGIGEFSSLPAAKDNQPFGRLEEQFNLNEDDLPEISPYCEKNERPKDSGVQDIGRSNRNELVSSDYRENYQHYGGKAGLSIVPNSTMLLPNLGDYTTESKESLCWKELSEQCPGSCWIGPQDEIFNPLDQNKPLSLSGGGNISVELAAQQGNWTSLWLDPSEDHTEIMNNCYPTVQNNVGPHLSEATEFLLGSDDIVPPTAAPLLQEVHLSKVSAHSSGTRTHEAISDYIDQVNQLGVSLEADSMLTLAEKQRFKIQEISPEWGYATENTKVIIAGSFLYDPSECEWSCMFGDIEVPIQIIQEGVLLCQAPPHIPGKVTLCITSSNREACSEVREFEYRIKPSICENCSSLQRYATKNTEEQLLLVRFAQMVLCDSLVRKEEHAESVINVLSMPKLDEDPWEQIIYALLVGNVSQISTVDWVLQELLKDKLQHWLSSKYKEGDPSGCSLSKKEQGIIHLVAGLGFEWALNPILKCGVCVNYRDIKGWTGLHWAARFGREKMVAALIAAGAAAGAVTDPTSQDPVGKTPGSIAAASGHKGLAGYLSELALTSHLSSITLEESDISRGSAAVEAERSIESISNGSVNSTDNQLSHSLAAVRKSAEAAARIQSFFRAHSLKRRKQREAAAACCEEYGITPDELAAASKFAFRRFRDHIFNKAVLSIQKKYRGWKGRQEFLALRQKIVMIQAHVRGYQVRKRYKVFLWTVGILDKVVLRWCRKRVGLRGFQPHSPSDDESEYEDILKGFRKLKVDRAVEESLLRVLSMVESPEARHQYWRILKNYRQAKAELLGNASETASISQDTAVNMETLMGELSHFP